MTIDLVILVLLLGAAFVAGAVLTLVVSERTSASRAREQAVRERELQEFSAYVDEQLRVLAAAEHEPT